MTLVSIVTPTIVGREQSLKRCTRSVRDQNWPQVQHVVVSDRNPAIAAQHAYEGKLGWCRNLVVVQINETWRSAAAEASIGAIPFWIGSTLALGEFVGFCGDDDELLPDHITRHVMAMREHEAMFSISAVDFRVDGQHRMIVGPSYEHGNLDAIGIMCHVEALRQASWSADGTNAADWRLVRDWQGAGLRGVLVPGPPTAVHHDGWLAGKTGRPDRPGGGYTP